MTTHQPADSSTLTEPELVALVDKLTDRVIKAESARTDAEDLRRENDQLRETLAKASLTGPEAVAQMREWVPDYDDGWTHVAMPAAMAQKILADREAILADRDRIARQRDELLELVGKLTRP